MMTEKLTPTAAQVVDVTAAQCSQDVTMSDDVTNTATNVAPMNDAAAATDAGKKISTDERIAGAGEKDIMNYSGTNGITPETLTQARIAAAQKFFGLIYSNVGEKFSYLWTLPDHKTFSYRVSTEADLREMACKAIELNDAGFNVYHGVNCGDFPAPTGKRYTEAQVSVQTAVVVDIDIRSTAHKGNPNKFPPDFATAKSFLPFAPTILVNSGYGLHAYYCFDEPLEVTVDNREEIKRRNKSMLDVVRQRAGQFAGAVDGVDDLPRILRTLGTFNYKCGKDNPPLCHVVEVTDTRFTPADLDEKLNALLPTPAKETSTRQQSPETVTSKKSARQTQYRNSSTDTPEYDNFRVSRMLDKIRLCISALSQEQWLAFMSAAKNLGVSYSEVDEINRCDVDRYDEQENLRRWKSLTDPSFDIETLHGLAKLGGYDEKSVWREYYRDRRADTTDAPQDIFAVQLSDALVFLNSLASETITAEIALAPENIRNIAIAQLAGFVDEAENFFTILKAAKTNAKNKLREADDELITLSDDEHQQLKSLAAIDIATLRLHVKREVSTVAKQRKTFLAEQKRMQDEQRLAQMQVTEEKTRDELIADIVSLRQLPQTPERDATIRKMIRDCCEWKRDRRQRRTAIKDTAANTDLIFTRDPDIDGLFAQNDFRNARVFLKSAPWRQTSFGDEWTDADDDQLQFFLRKNYGEIANEKLVRQTFTHFAELRRFHEVQQYFRNLPKWDGVKRAETLFIDWLGVDDNAFTREVTWKFLLGAIARIFHAGCRFQWALVIHGKQHVGKSFIFERLGGKWHITLSSALDDPHAVDDVQVGWLIELKEFACGRKSELNSVKSFLERHEDTYRAPYARTSKHVKRHCIFTITINDDGFLTDLTGNRRFQILHSSLPKFGYVKEVRGERLTDDNVIAQIWAEVYQKFQEMFANGFDEKKLELSDAAKFHGEHIAEQYLRDDGSKGAIQAYLNRKIPPLVIWNLLLHEERRKFIAEGKIVIERRDLEARFENLKRITDDLRDEFTNATKPKANLVELTEVTNRYTGETKTCYIFYGAIYREHIAAVEIAAECFDKTDRRKSAQRINEILQSMGGWALGKSIRRDPCYGNLPKVFWRENNPDNDDEPTTNQPTNTEPAPETATPEPTSDDYLQGEPLTDNERDDCPFDPDDLPI